MCAVRQLLLLTLRCSRKGTGRLRSRSPGATKGRALPWAGPVTSCMCRVVCALGRFSHGSKQEAQPEKESHASRLPGNTYEGGVSFICASVGVRVSRTVFKGSWRASGSQESFRPKIHPHHSSPPLPGNARCLLAGLALTFLLGASPACCRHRKKAALLQHIS